MGKFSDTVILSDLDGTFLDSRSCVVERNIKAIEYFKANGGRFTLCTGRMHYGLENTIPDLPRLVNVPAIHCNGAYLYDYQDARPVSERFLAPEAALAALSFVRSRFPTVFYRIPNREGYLLPSGYPEGVERFLTYRIPEYTVSDPDTWRGEEWYKVVFTEETGILQTVEAALEERFSGVFEYNWSGANGLEMQMKGTNKATALPLVREWLAARGEARRIYACGDYKNDAEVLSAADVAVCPANAHRDIEKMCDHCLCDNNSGVIADVIELMDAKLGEVGE